ncbi:MAG TPA: GMC family oxidoreductase [Vicinamibacterales bacterium]|nr:GMC family oxidoreductase [Vicinamibacterales bacterium]
MRLECDILIVGSGAAGGVLAATLSELTSRRIILADKGAHYTAGFFNQREWDMGVLYADRGARATVDGAIPVRGGECVGGGTTVNYALAMDPVRRVWARWRETGLTGFSFDEGTADYGVPGLNMAACLADVRGRIGVARAPDAAVNGNNRVLERGCRALGFSASRFELNMRDCLGCGFCAEGCAYDRKQGSLVTYVPDAMKRGVQLIHHYDIRQLTFTGRGDACRVTGATGHVRPTRQGSQPNSVRAGDLEIIAPLVIVCAGAIESPVLLQRSGHPDPYGILGRGLILHPGLPIIGVMNEPLTNYRGIGGTVYSDHFYHSHGFYYESLFGHPVYGAVILPLTGAEHFDMMRRFDRIAGFGVMLVDTPDLSNRVQWHAPTGTRRIRYRLSDGDRDRLRMAARTGVEIMFAGGAHEVLLASTESIGPLRAPRFRHPGEAAHCASLAFGPHQSTITSSHCQATVKMGEDPTRSMIDSRGESHHVRNLIVCDSSAFPESCGANPMLSIMTLARYQGRRIAGEAGRYAH